MDRPDQEARAISGTTDRRLPLPRCPSAVAGFIFVIAACGPTAVEPPLPAPPSQTDCGNIRVWDSDGDGLSDRVEENNATNGYADLVTGRCDPDPTVAVGRPGQGSITNALNLPDRNSGYRHFYGIDAIDTDDWGVLALLTCIEATGRALANTDILVQVGDLSLRDGGPFPPHAGHQNGLEADLRYVRRDRAFVPLDLRLDPQAYDPDATARLFDAMFDTCSIEFILVDLERLGFSLSDSDRNLRIIDAAGHSNHFHIRLRGA